MQSKGGEGKTFIDVVAMIIEYWTLPRLFPMQSFTPLIFQRKVLNWPNSRRRLMGSKILRLTTATLWICKQVI